MFYGIEADGGLTPRRLGTGALAGVASVGFGLLIARHILTLP
jgi:hypothetical protein